MTSLAGEERPRPAATDAGKRASIFLLTVAVMVVPMPYGTGLGVHLQHRIHHLDGIHNDGVVRGTNTISHQFEKPAVDHILRGEFALVAR